MLRKVVHAFLLCALLLTMLTQSVCAEQCIHNYILTGEDGCQSTYTCEYCHGDVVRTVHNFSVDVPCGVSPVCTRCGVPDTYTMPHEYARSLFGGFTYCRNCNDWSFSLGKVDWISLISFAGGAVFMVFIFIWSAKCRQSD